MSDADNLIYDWNRADGGGWAKPAQKIEFDDETLRDGPAVPSVTTPPSRRRSRSSS